MLGGEQYKSYKYIYIYIDFILNYATTNSLPAWLLFKSKINQYIKRTLDHKHIHIHKAWPYTMNINFNNKNKENDINSSTYKELCLLMRVCFSIYRFAIILNNYQRKRNSPVAINNN